MKIALSLVAVMAVVAMAAAAPQPKVASSLLRKLESGQRTNVFVVMAGYESSKAKLAPLKDRKYANRTARVSTVVAYMQSKTEASQKDLLAFLSLEKSADVDVRPLWITDKIILRNVDYSTVQKLITRADVDSIVEERMIPLHPLGEAREAGPLDVAWGVAKVRAEEVWAKGNTGQGIVVCNIDTGVRGGHEALSGNHRATYGWYDPAAKTPTAADYAGHGTHTMGSIAGGGPRGVGVAPGATWAACKGCGTQDCPDTSLTECGQWVANPTDPSGNNADPSKACHLVSNSWGGGQGDDFYADPISVWRAAGIIPLFSIGNSGSQGCGSANSPGDSTEVIGVGATNLNDRTSTFSSLGPAVQGHRKPDISGPGTDVVSASNLGNAQYATMSGTSMSCPHAAGLVALLLAEHGGELEYDLVKSYLEQGSDHHNPQGSVRCGEHLNTEWPNNHVGFGRINAPQTCNQSRA